MSWDIHGNPLRAGHCEVHPDIAQPFPCSICQSNQQPQFSEPVKHDADLQGMAMSDWILESEGLENERLFNVHTSIEYIKMSNGMWQLGNPREGFAISEYSDEVYQQIKSALLFRNAEPSCKEKTLRDEFAIAVLRSINIREHTTTQSADTIALTVYLIADAMMEERRK